MILRRSQSGIGDYYASGMVNPGLLGAPHLADNFHKPHNWLRAYFINGRNEKQETAKLDRDESIWLACEFEDAAPDISTVQIIFDNRPIKAALD
jgi:hypothetical protein